MSGFHKVEATLLASVFVFFSFRAAPQVIINEIMYHGPANLLEEEFIELYNAGDVAVNLEGWQFRIPAGTQNRGGVLSRAMRGFGGFLSALSRGHKCHWEFRGTPG
jgi:hypothetical protein